ncbi:hypothetical protein SAMN02799622_00894 [Methylobacterium sp. UNC378MF]|uniref:hypothetical protein n=1 Tax=Methylobacterium sp. UNC378MF TaxID=1502748 RepID=UPI000890F371|nr:hypothetical protein [Methylobacterium sp. UNC378MF]SDA13047.1 hypothetical protein SAMN02799622_00894 [Methylobacterium sp. UNC378MF]
MPLKPIVAYGVQLFVLLKGKLAQGRYIECNGVSDACKIAEEKVRTGRAVGAAAFTRTVVDPDYDDGSDPITLAIFGKVPPGLADQLPF